MTVSLRHINEQLATAPQSFVQEADARYDDCLLAIAGDIQAHRDTRPLVLISGPSGSGKTTTALKLEALLDRFGCETHTLSMDHFFLPLTPQSEETPDLESPDRVDVALLNDTLRRIAACEPVQLPYFDFVTNTRREESTPFVRKQNELLILEGIHVLNHAVVTLPDDQSTRLYVSVRTRVALADGREVHPGKLRLLRRMLRDRQFRGRPFEETLRRYESVERGENRYIMPYKHRADYDIDTFLPYEIGVYKEQMGEALSSMTQAELAEPNALLREAAALSPSAVPPTSLIREFLGNSAFRY